VLEIKLREAMADESFQAWLDGIQTYMTWLDGWDKDIPKEPGRP
jgi:hypothetical protein